MISFEHLRHVMVVLFAVGLGVVVPQAAHAVTSVSLLIVAFLVFSSLRGTTIARGDPSRFLLPATSVLTITYFVIPLLGVSWARYLLSGDALLGAAVVLSAPATAGSAIVWTRL